MLSAKYFKRAFTLPRGKTLLVGQVLLLIAGTFVFIRIVPWLGSSDISKISVDGNPSPVPPSWARAYSVNHGTYSYYDESPRDNPLRVWLNVGFIGALIVPCQIIYGYIWLIGGRNIKLTEQGVEADV